MACAPRRDDLLFDDLLAVALRRLDLEVRLPVMRNFALDLVFAALRTLLAKSASGPAVGFDPG